MAGKQKREAHIREVDNGFVVSVNITTDISAPSDSIEKKRYETREIVVSTLPQLVKKLKVFLEPEIVDEEEEE